MNQTAEVTITRGYDPEGNKPYNIIDEKNTRFSTFNAELGEEAKKYIGKRGVVTFTVKQNGQYTNNYFEKFEPIKTLDDELVNGNGPARQNHRLPLDPAEQSRIARAVALDRATDFLPYLNEDQRTAGNVIALAEQFREYLETT